MQIESKCFDNFVGTIVLEKSGDICFFFNLNHIICVTSKEDSQITSGSMDQMMVFNYME